MTTLPGMVPAAVSWISKRAPANGPDAEGKETEAVDGETLVVSERIVVAPAVGIFRPGQPACEPGQPIRAGQVVGTIEGIGTSTPVTSSFGGLLMGMLAWAGERVRAGQPVAWLRVS